MGNSNGKHFQYALKDTKIKKGRALIIVATRVQITREGDQEEVAEATDSLKMGTAHLNIGIFPETVKALNNVEH